MRYILLQKNCERIIMSKNTTYAQNVQVNTGGQRKVEGVLFQAKEDALHYMDIHDTKNREQVAGMNYPLLLVLVKEEFSRKSTFCYIGHGDPEFDNTIDFNDYVEARRNYTVFEKNPTNIRYIRFWDKEDALEFCRRESIHDQAIVYASMTNFPMVIKLVGEGESRYMEVMDMPRFSRDEIAQAFHDSVDFIKVPDNKIFRVATNLNEAKELLRNKTMDELPKMKYPVIIGLPRDTSSPIVIYDEGCTFDSQEEREYYLMAKSVAKRRDNLSGIEYCLIDAFECNSKEELDEVARSNSADPVTVEVDSYPVYAGVREYKEVNQRRIILYPKDFKDKYNKEFCHIESKVKEK